MGIAGITGLVPDRALPDGWHAAGADLRARGGELRAASRWPSWSGRSADAAAARLRVIADDLDVTGAAVGVVAVVVEAHVAALALIRATVTAALALARVAGLTVGDDGTLTGPGPATAGPGAVIGPVLRAAVRAVADADGLAARTVTLAVPPPAPVSTAPLALASTSPDPVTAARDTLTARGLDLPVTVLGADGTPAPGGDPGPGARRAVVVGDPDTAATVTTLVSGVGSTGPGGDATAAAWAASLARPGHAVVAWQGYDAPTSLSAAVADAPAVAGGRTLRDFQRSLRARHPRARLTVTGYSYGSVVVGRAAGDRADPLEADGVTLEGSPGVDAASAADLRLHATDGRPEVQVRRLPGDLIRLATGPVPGSTAATRPHRRSGPPGVRRRPPRPAARRLPVVPVGVGRARGLPGPHRPGRRGPRRGRWRRRGHYRGRWRCGWRGLGGHRGSGSGGRGGHRSGRRRHGAGQGQWPGLRRNRTRARSTTAVTVAASATETVVVRPPSSMNVTRPCGRAGPASYTHVRAAGDHAPVRPGRSAGRTRRREDNGTTRVRRNAPGLTTTTSGRTSRTTGNTARWTGTAATARSRHNAVPAGRCRWTHTHASPRARTATATAATGAHTGPGTVDRYSTRVAPRAPRVSGGPGRSPSGPVLRSSSTAST
ncbi:hypothetical protein CXF43_01335 [Corynebacterium bovis]|uniref:DUF1023 domain-containing protein n=1 Tax=Corynebacterium bovis TaxID=36808 RepID=A0A3R8PH48_9CORY|nr:hypothetical protein CXF40_11000 [Corynebacterium bovis]RRQ00152.1 hypothetical protein CXF41_07585 [Corynebacterium bovis]RRQ05567.1 hypothetical protein CXF42_00010 [Corynebacterium bovis]RRQ07972.1 hypothetical protein CXF43_01335 [Corynebacterium bovis]RRQ10465.1 hypothetical protein CXF44_04100 [Corynebacterium bovis]